MVKEHKSHQDISHWPYLAIVSIVAVVAVVVLVMQGGSREQVTEELSNSVNLVDEKGNVVGEAFRSAIKVAPKNADKSSYVNTKPKRAAIPIVDLDCLNTCDEVECNEIDFDLCHDDCIALCTDSG